MIKNRWFIPAAFGVGCLVLAIFSVIFSEKGVAKEMTERYSVGQSHLWTNIPLEADKRYTLAIAPANGVPLNREEVVSAALLAGGQPVFELEDAYWHERGTWREGGESGTWEEQNSRTEFNFLVPETGTYDFEMTLESSNSVAGDRLVAQLIWRDPWVFSAWPLFLGALALFGVAGWAHTTRRGVMGRFLEEMGVGSKLKIGSVQYEVIGRSEHYEGREWIGVEFRLRATIGTERWLAIDRYWREHPWIEDGDQTVVQILLDVPLHPTQKAQLEGHDGSEHLVMFGDEVYTRDNENGGNGTMVTIRDGAAYRSRYRVEVYRDQHRFPMRPGERWIEFIRWFDDNHQEEWAVMEIADWESIDVLKLEEAEKMSIDEIFREQSSDPFGVRANAGDSYAGAVMSQDQPTDQQKKEQSQHEPFDWNS